MKPKKYKIKLSDAEKIFLEDFIKNENHSSRKIIRARILLLSNNELYDKVISKKLNVDCATIYRIRRRYCEEGLENALMEKNRSGARSKLNIKDEEKIIRLVCSDPPEKYKRWTVRLLTDQVCKHGMLKWKPSKETIRKILIKYNFKIWNEENSNDKSVLTILNDNESVVIIPNGCGDRETLTIKPGQRIKIYKLTSAIKKAVCENLVKIV